MAEPIPQEYLDLFEKKAFGFLATLMPDGSPQVTPVWVDYDGKHVLVNSAIGRQKDENIAKDPRVAITILDPDNAYRYLQVRGRVVEATTKGAEAHIDKMALKYWGKERYSGHTPDEQRVIYKIAPEN